jgi:hypothetical protein
VEAGTWKVGSGCGGLLRISYASECFNLSENQPCEIQVTLKKDPWMGIKSSVFLGRWLPLTGTDHNRYTDGISSSAVVSGRQDANSTPRSSVFINNREDFIGGEPEVTIGSAPLIMNVMSAVDPKEGDCSKVCTRVRLKIQVYTLNS